MTGISPSTLNFWMREGVLRAESGGGGKGIHRRFPFTEVNLAAVLNVLRNFGMNLESLSQVAALFHDAIDYIQRLPSLNDDEEDALFSLAVDRRRFLEEGFSSQIVRSREEFSSHPRFPWMNSPYVECVHLSWQELIDWHRKSFNGDYYSDRINRIVETINPEEYLERRSQYNLIARIPDREYDEADYFVRNSEGQWLILPDQSDAARISEAFIGLNFSKVIRSVWDNAND
ncbi:MerR family transcriptional regulator [Sphingomonas arantia]|uniref:MerR family transcriptional regulator n=1 Tax=Sphingomonas arantia TaxID=1460676 RepID=A0ABW4U0K6_9SPHN